MDRRRMMMQSGGGLPSNYQQVEYIERVDDNSWLALKVFPTDGIEIVCDCYITSIDTYNSLFGVIFNKDGKYYRIQTYQNRQYSFGVSSIYGNTTTMNRRFLFKANKSGYYDNDELLCSLPNETMVDSTIPLFLFGINYGLNYTRTLRAKIYDFIVNIKGKMKNHLVPCYRKSDHKQGMYDIVNGVFYTNQGTGEFIVGPDVN